MSVEFSKRPIEEQLAALLELAKQSLAHWNISDKSISLIKHRENAVYKVLTDDDQLYALRVHRGGYHSDLALESEFQWMSALQSAGINVPEAVPCIDGRNFALVSHDAVPDARQVDLLAWIDGEQLGSVEEGLGDNTAEIESIYATIGGQMARLHEQSCQWSLPPGFTRHAWDKDGLVGEEPFWGQFWKLAALTPEQRSLVANARSVVSKQLSALDKTPSNYGMIHADMVPENLLVDGDKVRLIDFDDAGFGWYMFDVATALYFIQDDPNYKLAKNALLNAYQKQRPLDEATLNTLPLFMLARSFTYLGWVHTRPGTDTAEEMTPVLVDMCCELAQSYSN